MERLIDEVEGGSRSVQADETHRRTTSLSSASRASSYMRSAVDLERYSFGLTLPVESLNQYHPPSVPHTHAHTLSILICYKDLDMLPPRTWSFPTPPPTSFCKRIWEHPHDGEKFTFTLDEMTTGPDAQYQGIHINLFYLLNALSYRWEENNAGSAWRGAYIASISNVNTTKFDCERCAMDGARCYRGSKGQGSVLMQQN